jgi:hypothetical protein
MNNRAKSMENMEPSQDDQATMTISGAGQSVTVTGDGLRQITEQLDLPFPVDQEKCKTFLDSYLTIEDEIDRLRAELHGLLQDYKTELPIRAVRTAIKVVRARKKLAEHPKEAMRYEQQARLEGLMRDHIEALDATKEAAVQEVTGAHVPDMTRGEEQENR